MIWKRLAATIRHVTREFAAATQEYVGGPRENMFRSCTCGNTRKYGPCPRHGKLT